MDEVCGSSKMDLCVKMGSYFTIFSIIVLSLIILLYLA